MFHLILAAILILWLALTCVLPLAENRVWAWGGWVLCAIITIIIIAAALIIPAVLMGLFLAMLGMPADEALDSGAVAISSAGQWLATIIAMPLFTSLAFNATRNGWAPKFGSHLVRFAFVMACQTTIFVGGFTIWTNALDSLSGLE
jgi:hypothetical protein